MSDLNCQIVLHVDETYFRAQKQINAKSHSLSKAKANVLDLVPETAQPYVNDMVDMLMAKNYSASTLKSYTGAFITFLRAHDYKNPEEFTKKVVVKYLAKLSALGLKSSSGHMVVNALKFYYKYVLEW